MIGIFLKELRENLKWAAIIFGVIVLTIYTLMRQHNPELLFLLSDPRPTPIVFFVPIAGLLMGIMQSFFETRPDNWAFVVHRPVSRPAIFAAKCAAGLLLLYVSTELPCLLAAAWAARPGNLRMPFQARALLPGLAVTLNSGCYYFAAIVLTLRKARWLGTRLLPLGLAIACSLAVRLAPEFWQVMLFILAGHCIGAMAAWGVFSTGGAADRGVTPRLALGAMIYSGAAVIGIAIIAFLGIFQVATQWTWWRVDHQGNIVSVTTFVHDNRRTFAVSDLSGKRLTQYDGVDLDDPAHKDRFVRFQITLIDDKRIPWPASSEYWRGSYRTSLPGVIPLRAAASPGARMRLSPMYDVEQRIIDLYDSSTRMLIGTVGPGGFAPARTAPAERFPGPPLIPSSLARNHTLAFDSVVYWLELDHRRVRKLFDAAPDDPIIAAGELPPDTDPTVVIATRRHLHLMHPSGQPMFTAALDADMEHRFYEPAILSSNQHLVTWTAILSEDGDQLPTMLEFSTDGTLLRQSQLPKYDVHFLRVRPRVALAGVIYPLAGLPFHRGWILDVLLQINRQGWWLFHGWLFASSLASGLLALLLARRLGLAAVGIVSWTFGSLLLGPGAIAAMLGILEWPARETCEACSKPRLAKRPICTHCRSNVPAAALDGRELFDSVEFA